MRGKELSKVMGKWTKLVEGERDLELERAIFGIIMFMIITIFWIRDFYIRDCFVREKFVAPIFLLKQAYSTRLTCSM
jgi:hypothetical protein